MDADRMNIPNKMLDAACAAAFVPPISDDRRSDMRKALEITLLSVRESVSDEMEGPAPRRAFVNAFDAVLGASGRRCICYHRGDGSVRVDNHDCPFHHPDHGDIS